MGATRDAVGLIGSVLKSLASLLIGEESEKTPNRIRPDWQTTEEKANAARRLSNLRRKMAYCDKMTPTPKAPTEDSSNLPPDAA